MAAFLRTAQGAEPLTLGPIDLSKTDGVYRPLHGINKGPLVGGGLIDVTEPLRALGIPSIRLHDCRWPNPDVVDMHAVFPDFSKDPNDPASYDFAGTDEYIAAALKTGAKIVYRLGESIEHTKRKRFVHPPKDYDRWAAVCIGIIRHYNEGWADGYRHGIQYWEIWNEPENRPVMWSGTDEDYFRLYRTAAKAIRARFPNLKIGGPAVGASGRLKDGEFQPTAFVTNFLNQCRAESLPLDFFSWHCYTADFQELAARGRGVRKMLDAHGFQKTESHLNEWNFLPRNTWGPISKEGKPEEREAFYQEMAGPAGGAFIVRALLTMQDAAIDVGQLFHGEIGGFGLFSENGVPQKNYHAIRAFRALMDTPRRVKTGSTSANITYACGLNAAGTEIGILICNAGPGVNLALPLANLPWRTMGIAECRITDERRSFETAPVSFTELVPVDFPPRQFYGSALVELELSGPSVVFIHLQGLAGKPGE